MKKYYVTTPIYYVNDKPHLGHIYTTLAADVIARFKRQDGYDVFFLTGTDEHGQKMDKTAKTKGVPVKQFCDENTAKFKDAANTMNFSYDYFIRTTDENHIKCVQDIWQKMMDKGAIYLGKYAGWYAVRDEAFYDESEIIDGFAPTGAPVEWVEEESYFFRLSDYQDRLLKLYEEQPDFVMPEYRKNEVISFVKSGLHDLSVSRTTFSWGIPVPNDPKHVMYVWLDALFNYWTPFYNKDEPQSFWPADVHIVGKDILRFHAVYWPAFLMAIDLPLPKRVFAHGWWLVQGEKMSKSLGNVLDPLTYVEKYGLDYVRYFLMREMPFGNDHSFSHESFLTLCNSELANKVGNLVQRVVSFVHKFANGVVPQAKFNDSDKATLLESYAVVEKMRMHIDKQAIHLAFEEVVKLANAANEYMDYNAPWSIRNTDEKRMNTVLYTLIEMIRVIAILLKPIVPTSSDKILDILEISQEKRMFDMLNAENAIASDSKLREPSIIFPRITE